MTNQPELKKSKIEVITSEITPNEERDKIYWIKFGMDLFVLLLLLTYGIIWLNENYINPQKFTQEDGSLAKCPTINQCNTCFGKIQQIILPEGETQINTNDISKKIGEQLYGK